MRTINGLQALGRVIRAKRRQDGLTQGDLAAMTGVSTRFICELERGKPAADFMRIMAVLNALGLAVGVAPRGWPERAAEVPAIGR